MVDQVDSTFRSAILEEERQKAQQQGETMFYALVGAISPSVTSFSPCARVAIGLVEQLVQVLCLHWAEFYVSKRKKLSSTPRT